MADKYSSDLMRIVIAQITQTIGYSSTLSAPLELLQDILLKFMQEFARDLHGQMEHANRLEPNLKDARLTLKSLSINVHELLDYIGNVEPVAFTRDIAAFPIKRASNMNFLKPGSAETLTRPIYIFEYLPPMQPNAEPSEPPSTATNIIQDSELRDLSNESEKTLTLEQESSSKIDLDPLIMVENRTSIPIDSQSQSTLLNFPSNKNCDPDNGRTVREMSSVVMTTGGFISPAIEGKLPDAFVPDIIEKYKGLHAPPVPSPVIAPLETSSTKPDTSVTEENRYFNSTSASKLNERDQQRIENRTTAISKNGKKEGKFVMPQENPNPSVAVMLNAKTSKKSKKQKHFLSNLSGMERSKAEMNVHGGKAQEKAQRKAMKMFQKLAKSQNDGGSSQLLHLKKSRKRLNRGTFPSLPDGSSERIKLEKILKKQAKHRQKQLQGQSLQSELESKPLDIAPTTSDPANVALTSKAAAKSHEETAIKSNADSRTTVVGKHTENQDEFPLVGPASEAVGPQVPQIGLSATKKHNSEPERNKLDIFKKISKPKTPRLDGPGLSGSLAVAGNLFESTASPPLINLPSGTTITPAPALGLSMEHINVASSISAVGHQMLPNYGVMMPTPQAPSPQSTVDLMIIDSSKPKKRGRKPGGKNQTKPIHSATDTVAQLESQPLPTIQSMKKGKQNHINALSVSLPSSTLLMNPSLVPITIPTEPLNLSNVPQCKVKEKKDRKRYKTKYDSFLPENEKEKELGYNGHSIENTSPTKPFVHGTKPSSIVPGAGQYMAVGGGMPHAALYPSNPAGIVPLLPLLHFPPRPGLIPSGPGLFPATAGLVGFGSSVSMPPFMPFPGTSGAVTDSVCRSSALDTSADQVGQFLRVPSALTDSQTERTYCNVAPLVPESMKFSVGGGGSLAGATTDPTGAEAVSKPKTKPSAQATGNLGDPIEVSDDSDESTQNKKQLSPTNLGRSSMLQPQLLPYAITPATSIDDSLLHSKDILHHSISPNFCESTKKFKKQSKLGHPDVKVLASSATPSCNTPCFPQFNMPNFKGGDKFSLAGGADLIPLSRLECGLAYSSQTVPATSLSAGATSGSGSGLVPTQLNISEDQQFMPSFSSYEDITITPTNTLAMGQGRDELKMRKLHKKLKKPKEGKVKKKKDKKDKLKEKERNGSNIHKIEKKIKGPDKKQKKEKKKDKQIMTLIPADAEDFLNNHHLPKSNERSSSCEVFSGVSVMPSIPIQPSPKYSPNAPHDTTPKLELSPNPVPKLTLKLGGKSTPLPCADKDRDAQDAGIVQHSTMGGSKRERERDDSPELARFSPLVTGPPKAKPCETPFSSISNNTVVPLSNSNTTNSPVKPLTISLAPMAPQMVTSHPAAANSGGWMPNTSNSAVASSTLSASSVLLPQQLMLASKPIVNNFTSVMGVSTETPLGTGLLPVSPNNSPDCPPQIVELNRPSSYVDAEGNRIWICPACGKVDDGSAMIGCDGCDAWYHWTCVGINVAPKDNDDWFCRVCITKKKVLGSEKKKKRNKKK
ncbi:transcription initiation factor TFIID subunit 3 isoform X2 [Drosophila obscura]|uniref:transcription initiation factor TFIID subunit 3 isoform X2 n=1 Tax=Drosophila obscura TaxID=7282 RepID=UPI000BA06300|nr:transcription initiation factor TFIID subunit 3 isoform X2 [Drosophila obscura]